MVSYPSLFGLAGLACFLHPDRTASGNGKWPPPPEPEATPLHWAWPAGRQGQVGGGFLWTRSFTHRKTERKLKDKAI